jgi:hypothetical protein
MYGKFMGPFPRPSIFEIRLPGQRKLDREEVRIWIPKANNFDPLSALPLPTRR